MSQRSRHYSSLLGCCSDCWLFWMAFKILITNFFTALERLQLFLKKKKRKEKKNKQHTIIRGFNLPSGRSCAKYHLFEKEKKKKKKTPRSFPVRSSFPWAQNSSMSCRKRRKSTGLCQAPASCESCSTRRHCCSDRHGWRRRVDSMASFTRAQAPSVVSPFPHLFGSPPSLFSLRPRNPKSP